VDFHNISDRVSVVGHPHRVREGRARAVRRAPAARRARGRLLHQQQAITDVSSLGNHDEEIRTPGFALKTTGVVLTAAVLVVAVVCCLDQRCGRRAVVPNSIASAVRGPASDEVRLTSFVNYDGDDVDVR